VWGGFKMDDAAAKHVKDSSMSLTRIQSGPLTLSLRIASAFLGLVVCLAALRTALPLLGTVDQNLGVVWLVSGLVLACAILVINEKLIGTIRARSRGGLRLAQAFLWAKGAIGIAIAFKFDGAASVLGWAVVAAVLALWLLIQWARPRQAMPPTV
jgi:hypothetical protein